MGNKMAGVMGITPGHLQQAAMVGSASRCMFVVGTLPALLAIAVMKRLHGPEQWAAYKGPSQAD